MRYTAVFADYAESFTCASLASAVWYAKGLARIYGWEYKGVIADV